MIQVGRTLVPEEKHVRIYTSREILTSREREVGMKGCRKGSSVLVALLEIPGIEIVFLSAYSVVVYKAHTWEWEEIEPVLLRFLSAFNAGEGNLLA